MNNVIVISAKPVTADEIIAETERSVARWATVRRFLVELLAAVGFGTVVGLILRAFFL